MFLDLNTWPTSHHHWKLSFSEIILLCNHNFVRNWFLNVRNKLPIDYFVLELDLKFLNFLQVELINFLVAKVESGSMFRIKSVYWPRLSLQEVTGRSSITARMNNPGRLKSSSSELDLDQPNIEDYLPSGSTIQQEPHGKLSLYAITISLCCLYCYLILNIGLKWKNSIFFNRSVREKFSGII